MARHIRKGDNVMVTAGRKDDRGRTGEVLRVVTADHPDDVRVVVQGVNVRAKNIKPSQANPQGGMIRVEMPIHVSNVSPVDKNGKATRVRFETKDNGAKIRVAATTGEQIGPELKKAR
ncbi:MAG: 50S ribosomal protein L24 [Algisphaera sp.]